MIRPLEGLAQSPLRDEIDPALFESMKYQGHTWSVPLARITRPFFTVPVCLRQLGLPVYPNLGGVAAGGSSDSLDTDGDKRIDQHGILLPLGKENSMCSWLPFMWAAAGELVNAGKQEAGASTLVNQVRSQLWFCVI